MAWFRRDKPKIESSTDDGEQTVKTEGIFVKCLECDTALYKRDLSGSSEVCTNCGYHFRYPAESRLKDLFDDARFEKLDEDITSGDPLGFVDSKPYYERIDSARASSGLPEAIICGKGLVGGHLVYAGAMDMSFIGGSMGSAVGEKITRLIEYAIETRGAVVIFSASGGARMQEGTLSLMQMGKISAALARLHQERLPFISVLTDPTTGGVTASFAMLGDVILAEPKALIGFAGPRVIEQTIRQKLPKGFQRSEFLLEHGMVDMVVDRREMKATIVRVLDFMMNPAVKGAN
ncbi:MAG: acetyl-CoA carboxylase carboxyltransferase subunit beta [Chloracidobacterium sp.]|nr:acetyl-CoA carboxylase carboxyltransferase subunit beta [Chloracidobacterium sp.]MCO5332799.1 acetyl-CoA carboxylase, carboxyltransferase subunit beta [Pyrinomonadaceae bacterium]